MNSGSPKESELPDIDVLAVSKLSPLYTKQLDAAFKLHDRLHQTDPTALAAVAPRIRAIAASGDSTVDAALIAQFPALQIISVMGVGYDGVDVAAAKARGSVSSAWAASARPSPTARWPSA